MSSSWWSLPGATVGGGTLALYKATRSLRLVVNNSSSLSSSSCAANEFSQILTLAYKLWKLRHSFSEESFWLSSITIAEAPMFMILSSSEFILASTLVQQNKYHDRLGNFLGSSLGSGLRDYSDIFLCKTRTHITDHSSSNNS